MNSRLLDFYLKKISTTFRGGFFSYARRFIEQLPIYVPDRENDKQKVVYEEIVSLVDRILELNEEKQGVSDSAKRELLDWEVKVREERIDELVYDLYGLTIDERRIVEEAQKRKDQSR